MGNAVLKSELNDIVQQKKKSYSKINVSHPLDEVFSSDSYFIEQPFMQITQEGYEIHSDDKSESFHAIRHRSWIKRFLARLLGLVSFFATFGGLSFLVSTQLSKDSFSIIPALGLVIFATSAVSYIWVCKKFSPKRTTTLYGKGEKTIFKITPTSGEFIFNKEFHLKDQNNKTMIVFKRKFIDSIFRKKWHAYTTKGKYMFSAVEDNIFLALLRRYLIFGSLIPLHFHLSKGSGKPFGFFKRKFSLRDKYKLNYDSKAVPGWIVIAAAILLDTGEER